MINKKPNNFIAPIVIAGITVGFLASAYKFVFAKPKKSSEQATAPEQVTADQQTDESPSKLPASE